LKKADCEKRLAFAIRPFLKVFMLQSVKSKILPANTHCYFRLASIAGSRSKLANGKYRRE